ncbi:hypothetical protein FM113_01155 [Leucobacter sp. 7(1)]|uniref:hypothetical protein n=1 Tax=Leucobacter sp. 7(1) TaxID=1255613 RepID=UPI00097F0571|nr:hypothetical protein [Leucobacter sp. 7(1)]SJN08153.1 hypothetical protein FM113_01155 [Leucobacter sp. 7(1)]
MKGETGDREIRSKIAAGMFFRGVLLGCAVTYFSASWNGASVLWGRALTLILAAATVTGNINAVVDAGQGQLGIGGPAVD